MKFTRAKKIILSIAMILVMFGFGIGVIYAQDNFGVDQGSFGGTLQSPGGDLRGGIQTVVQWLLSFLGIVAVLVILYGGYIWMTAGGEAAKVEKAKKILIGGVIGLVIILTSFAIVTMVFSIFYPPDDPSQSCTPGDARSCSVANCSGTQVCTNDEVWGSCVPTGFCPALSEQTTWIWQLESATLNWKKRFGHTVIKTIDIPAQSDLQLTAYARNRGGSIANIVLEQAASSTSPNFQQYSNNFNPTNTSESEFYPKLTWDTSSYTVDALWWLRTKVTRSSGEDFLSSILMTRVAPAHCFNGIQDANETSVDCGDGCSCDRFPEITSITPDNGATGNYVTISGRYFGAEPGYVEFRDGNNATIIPLELPAVCGGDGWRDYQIIIIVPDLSHKEYQVTVCNEESLCSSEDVSFTINDVVRPGVCNVTNLTNPALNAPPRDVVAGTSTQTMGIFGTQFPLSGIQNVVWNFRPTNVTSTATFSTAGSGTDVVPGNRRGHSSIAVFNGTQYSNPYTVNVGEGGISDPCGNGDVAICAASQDCNSGLMCDPTKACTCQPAPNICGDNILGPAESCELVDSNPNDQLPGEYQYRDPNNAGAVLPTNQCSNLGLGSGSLSCNECRINTQQCEFDPFARRASQSIYGWAFTASLGSVFPELAVIEECDRTQTCRDGQRLPSPTPWFEGDGADNGGWNASTTDSYIAEPRVCVNAIIGARFTTNVTVPTINNSNIVVLECDTKEGANCNRLAIPNSSNNIIVGGDDNGTNSFFQLIPNRNLTPNKWYKVLLTDGIKSDANKSLSSLSEAELGARSCLGITYGGTPIPSNVAYCWNFQTRATDQLCAVGCINCTPDPTKSFYANQQHYHNATPDSADNVCLSLNPNLYNWTWTEKEFSQNPIIADQKDQYLDPRNWVPGPVRNLIRKSELLYASAGWNDSWNGSVSQLETIYDQPEYVRIEAKENTSGNAGHCKAINDFTNPVVIEDRECRAGTTQSPTPWKGSTDACVNAVISARFSRPMVDSSIRLYGSGSRPASIAIETCDSDDPDTCTWNRLSEADLRNQDSATDPEVVVFDYSHNINYSQLQAGLVSGNVQGVLPEGFYIRNFKLEADTWYRVIISGGNNGVRGSRIVNNGTEDVPVLQEAEEAQGILLTPTITPGRDFNGDLYDDYYYAFKTTSSETPCAVDTVNVSPFQKFMRYIGENQQYSAFPQAANCNLLNPNLYQYNWRSLLELGDDDSSVAEPESGGGSASGIAPISSFEEQPLTYHQIAVTGATEGFVYIQSRVLNTRPANGTWQQDKKGHGELTVGLGDLRITRWQPRGIAQCTTEKVVVDFNIPVKVSGLGTGLNSNIEVYRCASGDNECAINPSNRVTLVPLQTVDYNNSSELTRIVIASSSNMWATSTTYRVVVKGGASGVQSWNNKPLTGLNYRLSSKAGEECDGGALCTNQCLFDSIQNLCGTEFAECEPPLPVPTAYYSFDGNASAQPDVLYNGTNQNVRYVTGRSGQAAFFDGTYASDSIVVLPSQKFSSQKGTIAAWVKADSVNANGHIIYFNNVHWTTDSTGINGFGGQSEAHLTLGGNKKFIFYYGNENRRRSPGQAGYDPATDGDPSVPFSYALESRATYEPGRWYHVAVTYENGGKLVMYIDGAVTAQTTMTRTLDLFDKNNNARFWDYASVGRSEGRVASDSDARTFSGSIDDVALFNQILTPEQVTELAKAEQANQILNPGVSLCSATCHNLGTATPICGNSVVDVGEDCDDGNNSDGDACSAQCLNSGSNASGTIGGRAMCGNGIIETGEVDSYSWTFTVAPEARACNDVSIDGNPCPNGIRQIIFGKDVTSATISAQRGSDENNTAQSCEAADAQATFWRKAIERVKRVARKLVGIEVSAARYWCPEYANISLGPDDFEKMAHQTVVKNIMNLDATPSIVGEVIGYQNENGDRIINFIRDTDWSVNAEYRFKVDYEMFGVQQEVATTATRAVMTLGQVCPIEKVKVNIWPAGEEKYSDTFFCAGNDCGRATIDDPYDDDQDLETAGNQHMYRAWAMGRGGNTLYPVRADSFIWDMKNIPTADASSVGVNGIGYSGSYASTRYQGDQWVTGSRTTGDSQLSVEARSTSAGNGSGVVDIRTFICANPWPTPREFPYRDNGNNCKIDGPNSGNVCINTNFETYYCRDAGGPGREDDLPILGEYLSDGSLRTTVRGLDQKATMPALTILGGDRTYISDVVESYLGASVPQVRPIISDNPSFYSANWSDDNVDPIYHGLRVSQTGRYELILSSANYHRDNPDNNPDTLNVRHDVSVYLNRGDDYSRASLAKDENKIADINPKASRNTQLTKINLGVLTADTSYNILFDWKNDFNDGVHDSNFKIEKIELINETNNFSLIKEFLLPRGQSYTDYIFGRVPQVRIATESVPGKVGEASQFNSSRLSKIEFTGSQLPMTPAEGTIALWAKPSKQAEGSGQPSGVMIRAGDSTGNHGVLLEAINDPNVSGNIRFNLKLNGVSVRGNSHPVDQWYYVVGVYGDGKMSLYINGVQEGELATAMRSDTWNYLRFGRGHQEASHYTGALDEVRWYDRALSPVEVASLLTPAPAATIAGHLVAYYPFDVTSNDAVGIRVAGNPTHRSPSVWYQLAFAENKNETRGLLIDGYQSLSDGRTVYVNAADLNDVGNRIFGMMYIMSYTDGAEASTQDIYKQLTANWKFNVADADGQGGLREFGYCSIRSTKTCSRSSECADQGVYSSCISGQCSVACYSDSTCSASSNGICLSDKAKLTRDTKRLADAGDAQSAIDKYVAVKRCSTDHNRLCSNDSQCFGGGVCGNFAPDLKAGTYIANRTFSVWPSWQQTLSKTLGATMPTDPLNRLIGCTNPYDPTTCWDNASSRMKCPTDGWLYTYYAYNGGRTYGFYAHAEYSPTGVIWDTTQQRTFSLFSIGQLCRDDQNGLCGNNRIDTGEDCNNCPIDVRCGGQQACQRNTNSTSWQCVDRSTTPVGTVPAVCSDTGDADGDGVFNCIDRCPGVADPADSNAQCPGPDPDGDGRENNVDNCPNIYNPDQSDVDSDGIGDMCDACYEVDGQCLELKMTDSNNSAVNVTLYPYVSNKTAAQFYNLGSPNGITRSGILSGNNGSIFAYYDTQNNVLSLGAVLTYGGYTATPLGFRKISGDFPETAPIGLVRDDQNDSIQFSSIGSTFSWSQSSASDSIDGVLVPIGGLSKKWSIQVDGRSGTPTWYVVGPATAPRVTTQNPIISYGITTTESYVCNDAKREGTELCDCGNSALNYIFAIGNRTPEGRTWLCLSQNGVEPSKPYYLSARTYYWCAANASAVCGFSLASSTSNFCGDGVLTSNYEGCDASVAYDVNNRSLKKNYALDTNFENSSITNQYACSPTTCQDTGGYCGDGIKSNLRRSTVWNPYYVLSDNLGIDFAYCNGPEGLTDGRCEYIEQCDDGNTTNGDGCSRNSVGMCVIDPNYTCREEGGRSVCAPRCGNGINDEGAGGSPSTDSTVCDDGNRNDGDGCNSQCRVESDFICSWQSTNPSSVCTVIPPVSGDGRCEYGKGETWDNEVACAVYSGAIVTLKWDNSKFLSVNTDGNSGTEGVNANRDNAALWEQFKMSLASGRSGLINNGDIVRLTAVKNSTVLKTDNSSEQYLHARGGSDANFEATIELIGSDSVIRGAQLHFKALNGKYLDINTPEGHHPAHLGSANAFYLYDISGDAQIAINDLPLVQVAGVSEQAEIVGRSIKSWYYGFISSLTSVWKLIGSWVVTH